MIQKLVILYMVSILINALLLTRKNELCVEIDKMLDESSNGMVNTGFLKLLMAVFPIINIVVSWYLTIAYLLWAFMKMNK